MSALTLDRAQAIVAAALEHARKGGFKPLVVTVLDDRGAPKALAAEDGVSLKRASVAHAKAYGALSLGMGSRSIFARAQQQPYFVAAVGQLVDGAMVPVPGGVLIRDNGAVIGAVGISGDTSDNDEAAACAGIVAGGFVPDPGSD